MKTLLSALSLIALLALTGCLLTGCLAASVPQSKITIAGATFALPKNSHIGALNIELPTTNGVIRFYATNCVWENDVNVLNAVSAHDVAMANAFVALIQQGAKLGGLP